MTDGGESLVARTKRRGGINNEWSRRAGILHGMDHDQGPLGVIQADDCVDDPLSTVLEDEGVGGGAAHGEEGRIGASEIISHRTRSEYGGIAAPNVFDGLVAAYDSSGSSTEHEDEENDKDGDSDDGNGESKRMRDHVGIKNRSRGKRRRADGHKEDIGTSSSDDTSQGVGEMAWAASASSDETLWRALRSCLPSAHETQALTAFANRISSHLRSIHPTAKVTMFGSTVTGLALEGSDVDLSLSVEGLSSNVLLDMAAEVVRRREAASTNVNALKGARVPLLTVQQTVDDGRGDYLRHELVCDVTMNRSYGPRNSELIASFADACSPFRDICRLVKIWARRRCLPKVQLGGLSSYAWTLLVMRCCQAVDMSKVQPTGGGVGHKRGRGDFERVVGRAVDDGRKEVDGVRTTPCMHAALHAFFRFVLEFDHATRVVSVRRGCAGMQRRDKRWEGAIPGRGLVSIEDPIETWRDLGQETTRHGWNWIQAELVRGLAMTRPSMVAVPRADELLLPADDASELHGRFALLVLPQGGLGFARVKGSANIAPTATLSPPFGIPAPATATRNGDARPFRIDDRASPQHHIVAAAQPLATANFADSTATQHKSMTDLPCPPCVRVEMFAELNRDETGRSSPGATGWSEEIVEAHRLLQCLEQTDDAQDAKAEIEALLSSCSAVVEPP